MVFYIEMERMGPKGEVRVTLRDGPTPTAGQTLLDEEGHKWEVLCLHKSEVCLKPQRALEFPAGRALKTV